MIAASAGITTLFAVIVMIIGAVTLKYELDKQVMQACPNSKGAYLTNCNDALAKRLLLSAKSTESAVSFPSLFKPTESAAFFEEAMAAAAVKSPRTSANRLLASRRTADDDGYGYGYGYDGTDSTDYGYSSDGCQACCGIDKTMACVGKDVSGASINLYLIQFQEYVNYGCLACIVGVLPALLGAIGKMMENNCLGNTCGVASLCSTTLCSLGAAGGVRIIMQTTHQQGHCASRLKFFFFSFFFLFFLLSSFFFLLSSASCFLLPVFSFIGREKIAFYLTVIGAYIHLACTTVQASFATYEAGPSCNEECLAAQKHLVDEICDLGKAFGATGVLMALSAILGGVTTVMVCIGFCNNKKEEIVVQAVVVLPTAIAPIEYTNAKQWS